MIEQFIHNYGTIFSLFLRGGAFAICLVFILPLLLRQAGVKNGLRPLRIALLVYGVFTILNNLTSSYLLLDIIQSHVVQKTINLNLQVLNAFFALGYALLGYFMYHFQFTEENVARHEKIHHDEEKLDNK